MRIFGKGSAGTDAAGRVEQICNSYRNHGHEMIRVDLVLDLLKDDGRWTQAALVIPSAREKPPPDADPLTGCRPVTATESRPARD